MFDSGAPSKKRTIAEQLVRRALTTRSSVVSWQVVEEFLTVAQRKFAEPISIPDLQTVVANIFQPLVGVGPSAELFRDALDVVGRYRISWYDSLIVAAAAHACCGVLYSEDLQDGARIFGVLVRDPFREK